MIIKMRDVRAAKMCGLGAYGFCLRHGLDWKRFLREGLHSSELEATGDAMAIQVVEVARGRK